MKRLIATSCAIIGCAYGEVEIEFNGLRIVGKGYSSNSNNQSGNEEIRPFNWTSGTSLSLLVSTDDLSIVGLNQKESRLTKFTDDQGTDFLKVKNRFSGKAIKFGWVEVSQDAKALGTTIESDAIPAKGSQSLILQGDLVVTTGSKTEKVQSGTIALKEGAQIEVGGFSFKIKEIDQPRFGDAKMSLTLETQKNMDELKEIQFFDESGKEIESSKGGSGSWGFGGKMTYSRTYELRKKVSELEIGIIRWADLKEVKVPLDLKIGVGL